LRLADFSAADAVRSLICPVCDLDHSLHRLQPGSSLGLVAHFFYLLNGLSTTCCGLDACGT
jgi:hypothetical protein